MMKIIEFRSCRGSVIKYCFCNSRLGKLLVAATGYGVCYVGFGNDIAELESRFAGAVFEEGLQNDTFEVLHIKGTAFQRSVWEELLKIPLGQTVTYTDVAVNVGRPKAVRAVGSAIGRNPISIIIPCHRVVASSGKLGGYYWGVELKKQLLEVEKTGAKIL